MPIHMCIDKFTSCLAVHLMQQAAEMSQRQSFASCQALTAVHCPLVTTKVWSSLRKWTVPTNSLWMSVLDGTFNSVWL